MSYRSRMGKEQIAVAFSGGSGRKRARELSFGFAGAGSTDSRRNTVGGAGNAQDRRPDRKTTRLSTIRFDDNRKRQSMTARPRHLVRAMICESARVFIQTTRLAGCDHEARAAALGKRR